MSEKTKTNEKEEMSHRVTSPASEPDPLENVSAVSSGKRLALASLLSFLFACTPSEPPDDGHISQQMMRYALATDYELEVIIERLLSWLENEGATLIDAEVTADNYEDFLIPTLRPDDVVFHNRLTHGRDLGNATGVITPQRLDCSWGDLEKVLTDPNQAELIDDWENYTREYETDEGAYASGREELNFPLRPADLPDDLQATHVSESGLEESILVTSNLVDPESAFGTDIGQYGLDIDFRHGCTPAEQHFAEVRIFSPESAFGEGGSGLGQSYSIAVYLGNGSGTTFRIAATWSETVIAGETVDSEIILTQKARTGFANGTNLEEICESR